MSVDATVVTAIAGIAAALLAFRHQQRIRAFELFLARRESVLSRVEQELSHLHLVLTESAGEEGQAAFDAIAYSAFRDGLVLFHRMKGCNFGETTDALADTYFSVLSESLDQGPVAVDWLRRLVSCLSAWHALAHRSLSEELDALRFMVIPAFLRNSWRRRAAARRRIDLDSP